MEFEQPDADYASDSIDKPLAVNGHHPIVPISPRSMPTEDPPDAIMFGEHVDDADETVGVSLVLLSAGEKARH